MEISRPTEVSEKGSFQDLEAAEDATQQSVEKSLVRTQKSSGNVVTPGLVLSGFSKFYSALLVG